MTIDTATKIATDFLKDMNPDMWDGNGDKPKSFDERGWQYPLTDNVNLEITFVNGKGDGWHHCCDLVHTSDDSSFGMLSGYGIDSKQNIIDTVLRLCRDCEWAGVNE